MDQVSTSESEGEQECDYEELRASNIAIKWQFLREHGIQPPNHITPHQNGKRSAKKRSSTFSTPITGFHLQLRNHSQRKVRSSEKIKQHNNGFDSKCTDYAEMSSAPRLPRHRIPRSKEYGKIEGISVGDWWMTRLQCSMDGVHAPPVAGIHSGPGGAYSIALSGGYEDDIDEGDFFTYTGEGGRDLKGTKLKPKNLRTAPQSKDQELSRGNLALAKNKETGNPVRVIRGYKLRSKFAPSEGYRYDGLYNVENYWKAPGEAGFKVYRFSLKRCDSEPAPWSQIVNLVNNSRMDSDCSIKSNECNGERAALVLEYETVSSKVVFENNSWKEVHCNDNVSRCSAGISDGDDADADVDSPGPLDWPGWD